MYAEALWDHVTMNASELGLRAGQLVRVHGVTYPQWWFGAIGETRGWFPGNFVRVRCAICVTENVCMCAVGIASWQRYEGHWYKFCHCQCF